jgi:hypothetical protein
MPDDTQVGNLPRQLGELFGGAVIAPVIDHDDLVASAPPRQSGFCFLHGLHDHRRLVVRWNHQTDFQHDGTLSHVLILRLREG